MISLLLSFLQKVSLIRILCSLSILSGMLQALQIQPSVTRIADRTIKPEIPLMERWIKAAAPTKVFEDSSQGLPLMRYNDASKSLRGCLSHGRVLISRELTDGLSEPFFVSQMSSCVSWATWRDDKTRWRHCYLSNEKRSRRWWWESYLSKDTFVDFALTFDKKWQRIRRPWCDTARTFTLHDDGYY